MRLGKHLAHAGIASRRASEALVADGRVTVDGAVIKDPARDVTGEEAIAVDGELVRGPGARVVYALHKPAGVVSTAADTHGRPTVVDLVPTGQRLYPVGRLDADSSGLLLLTNDGALANRLTHPRYEVPKTYRATLERPVGPEEIEALRAGVELDDGPTAPAEVDPVGDRELVITLREGRNRQLRRMAEAVGSRVDELIRERIGSLELGDLEPGCARKLTAEEVAALWEDSGDERTA